MITLTEALAALSLGFLGSMHCVTMCGPLLSGALLTGIDARSFHLGYQSGRLFCYACIGFICGLSGAVFNELGQLARFPALATAVAGLFMIGLGLAQLQFFSALLQSPILQRLAFQPESWASRTKQRLHNAGLWLQQQVLNGALQKGGLMGAGALGLLTGLFPCGLLYAAYSQAAATAHPLAGSLVMVLFALASAPALLLSSSLLKAIAVSHVDRKLWLQRVSAVLLLVLGSALITNSLMTLSTPIDEACCHPRRSSERTGEH